MRIDLMGMIQEAHGPYGGRDGALRLSTLKDGTIIAVPRKTAMTGNAIHPLHAWARLQWIALDAYWRGLPNRIRTEWGKCTRYSARCYESRLDHFRRVNMPRAILGMPHLRLPPVCADSHCTYLERPQDHRRINRNAPLQLWVSGQTKPEPPWAPGDPLEPAPDREHAVDSQATFDFCYADNPNPLIPPPFCDNRLCPATVTHCRPLLHAWPYIDFEPYPGRTYFTWESQLDPESGDRTTPWIVSHVVESKRRWAEDLPYEKIMASHLYCDQGIFREHEIPGGRGWCLELIYWSGPAVKLSYAYYYQPLRDACPTGPFLLFAVEDVYGTYPWQEYLELQADGPEPGTPYPCNRQFQGVYFDSTHIATCIVDLTNPNNWAGLTWEAGAYDSTLSLGSCGGPAFLSATPIMCTEVGDNAGFYYFLVYFEHHGTDWLLLYRKPTHWWQYGPWGHYFIVADGPEYNWAPPCLNVWQEYVNWPQRDPNTAANVAWTVAGIIAVDLAIGVAFKVAARVSEWAYAVEPYSEAAIIEAAGPAAPAQQILTSEAWRCTVQTAHAALPPIKIGDHLAIEAWRRVHNLPVPWANPIPIPW